MTQPTHRATTPADATVPAQREQPGMASKLEVARAGLHALQELDARLQRAVEGIDDAAMAGPSALPGWTRAHLVTHLARNADALVNLLNWARTEIEQPAYASDEDRDADIEEGSARLAQVIREDFVAATGRFRVAAEAMPDSGWLGTVTNRQGIEIGGHMLPWMRAMETVVHLVDLDTGASFDDFADTDAEVQDRVLQYVVGSYRILDGTPSVHLHARFPDGEREYTLGSPPEEYEVSGTVPELLGWLTGRTDGAGLRGELPALPGWLK